MSGADAVRAESLRLRLDIGYDGTDFSGWAAQPGRRTVAGVLGEALATLFRAPVPMVVAGRTDAGVHAVGQVAHIDVDPAGVVALAPRHLAGHRDDAAADRLAAGLVGLRRRLAGLLPPDVRVPCARPAPRGFDARFSALRRHYRYRIVCSDWGVPPLGRADAVVWRRPLDTAAMRRAGAPLLGLHDFAAFCKPRRGATTIRDLQRLDIAESTLVVGERPAAVGTIVEIHVTADAFCHSMVRSLVGALAAVGEGRFEECRPAALLAARQRTAAIDVAPARGLTLVGVDYPPDADLADRADITRAMREEPSDCAGPGA